MEKEKKLTAYAISKIFPGIFVGTINARFKSPKAKENWGVEEDIWEEGPRKGKLRKYVPESKLILWFKNGRVKPDK